MQTFAWQGQGYRDEQSIILLRRGKRRPWQQHFLKKIHLIRKGCVSYIAYWLIRKSSGLKTVSKGYDLSQILPHI